MIGIVTSRGDADEASSELLQAAQARGGGEYVDPIDLTVDLRDGLSLLAGSRRIEEFDGFVLRGFNYAGEIDLQFEMFELAERLGVPVVNPCRAISIAESKPHTLYLLGRAGIPIPRTVACQTQATLDSALQEFGSAVIKPLFGALGEGVERVEWPAGRDHAAECLAEWRSICIQEYVPSGGRDIRAFVVGGRVLGAVLRIAQGDEWRTNVHQGGRCEPYSLSSFEHDLCERTAAIIGLEYTGLDILPGPQGPVILEVNGAPQWHGFVAATGIDVAGAVVERVLALRPRLEVTEPALARP